MSASTPTKTGRAVRILAGVARMRLAKAIQVLQRCEI
jgi:hypothetical protein